MATNTDFLGLTLPDGKERISREMLNENFELIDEQLKDHDTGLNAANALAPAINYGKALYVDATAGSDDNDGTAEAQYLTIEKAIAEARKHRACIINLAGGTYPTSGAIDIRGSCSLSVRGTGTSDNPTIINGRFSVGRGAWLAVESLTITGETTTLNGSVFCWEGAKVCVTNCIISPTGGYGMNASTLSTVYATGCTFEGTPTAIVRTLAGSTVILRSCTDNTGTGALCQNVGRLELNGSSAITYKASGTGFVSVDNVQRYPVDLSTLTATTSE